MFQQYWNPVENISTPTWTCLKYWSMSVLKYIWDWRKFWYFVFHTILILKNKQKVKNGQTGLLVKNQLNPHNLEWCSTTLVAHWLLNLFLWYGKWPISTKLITCGITYNTLYIHTSHPCTPGSRNKHLLYNIVLLLNHVLGHRFF